MPSVTRLPIEPSINNQFRNFIGRVITLAALPALLATAASAAASAPAVPSYQLSASIGLGAGKRWDYITLDDATHRIYLARADKVEVIDTRTRARVGTVTGLHGTHGVAIASALGRGFISDGKGNAVVIFDLQSLAVLRTVAVGKNPDAIVFDPRTGRVAAFNGASHDASILDAASGEVIALSLPLGGKPEFAQVDGTGHVYVNLEDTAEIVDVDLQKASVRGRYSIASCEEPSGLAINPARLLVSVCQNRVAIISNPATGKVVGKATIGGGPDGVVIDDGYAYSANGDDGSISVVPLAPEAGATVATIASRRSARTIAVDPATHALYLPSMATAALPALDAKAAVAAPAATKAGDKPSAESDEIEILVFTRR
jgi:DNA-binding beta-propeller fold protein YncE